MDSYKKKRLEERIVKKVSASILYKIDAFDRMSFEFWKARDKSKSKHTLKSNKREHAHVTYCFEAFYYACLEKWEKGELE